MEKIPLKQRDIILIPFPFSDQSGAKIRPALVLSNNEFSKTSQDIIACAITTQHSPNGIPLYQELIETGTLHDKCFIKPESVLKIHHSLIIKSIARVKKEPFNRAITLLSKFIKPD